MSEVNEAAIPAHHTFCKECASRPDRGLVLKTPAVPIIGQDPQVLLGKAVDVLQHHLAKKHPQALRDLQERAKEYMLFLGFSYFRTDDLLLLELWNTLRHTLRKRTERFTFEDGAIEANVSKLNLDSEQQAAVLAMMLDMRDVLLEQGRYALLQNQPAPEARTLSSQQA
jgi:hypothetical protein